MRVEFKKSFRKEYKKLTNRQKSAFDKRLRIFVVDTHAKILRNHKLKGEYAGYRSINITGDIRVVYYELTKDSCIFVRIGTHSELYE